MKFLIYTNPDQYIVSINIFLKGNFIKEKIHSLLVHAITDLDKYLKVAIHCDYYCWYDNLVSDLWKGGDVLWIGRI